MPCTAEDVRDRCVESIQRSRPDPEAVKGLIDDFTKRLLGAAAPGAMPEFRFEDPDLWFEVVLVTEPTTLIHHAPTIIQRSDLVLEAEGREQAASDTRIRELRFSYPGTAGL